MESVQGDSWELRSLRRWAAPDTAQAASPSPDNTIGAGSPAIAERSGVDGPRHRHVALFK
jgi:hypothetical protein